MSKDVRSLGMMSPKGTGKTSLVEAILFNAKIIKRLGKVEDGNTASDFDPEEIERGMTLFPSVNTFNSGDTRVHLLDTAGYPDFMPETRAVARAVDNAMLLINAADGVKSQAAKFWNLFDELKISRSIFVNFMDKELANFAAVLDQLRKAFDGGLFVPITVPMVKDNTLLGVIDLVTGKAYTCTPDGSGKFTEGPVPDDFADLAEEYKEKLVEAVAEMDDTLTEKYLESGELSEEEVTQGLTKGVAQAILTPVYAGSASLNVGVAQFMNRFLKLSAAPANRPEVICTDKDGSETTRKPDPAQPFSAFVFKTLVDQYAGKISLFRVVSGKLTPDSQIIDTNQDRKVKVQQLFTVFGKKQEPADQLVAGDIGAVVKIDEFQTGDTICDVVHAVTLPALKFPDPVLALAITPKERGDEDKLSIGLSKLVEEDPMLKVSREEQTQELMISGTGQIHLDSVVSRLKKRFAVDVVVSTPEVPYRETITKTVKVQGRHKKQSGGRGQFGDVWIELEPQPSGTGFIFENKIFGGSVPKNYIPAVEKGIAERMGRGCIAGYPMVDIKATIFDGSYHNVDSSDMAFRIAGSLAMQKGAEAASPVLLEPHMAVEVECPDECMGDIIGDINGRRGKVSTMDQGLGVKIVKATVPLSEMLRYAPELDSMTSGRGTYTMELAHYEEVPKKVAQDIIEAYQKRKAEEEDS
jgi:elongation factor G